MQIMSIDEILFEKHTFRKLKLETLVDGKN